ncbi:MAG: hypothetical protein LBR16_06685, partial [Treponema sp.]|nr:hypothetical protein [Treponema sp.]
MRKILFVIPAVMAVLLTGCPQGVTEDPTAAKTTVQFDNRERGFPVTIYTAHARQDADKITVVTPNTLSRKIEWAAGRSYFYISYHVALDALLRIIYTPTEATQGVMVADIEADQNNVIPPIPPLDSIVQRDTLMTEKVYFSVENRGSDPCRVLMADRVLLPSNMASGSGEIVSGGTGLYEVKEGSLSGYKIDKSGRTYNF